MTIQQAWNERCRLYAEGRKLYAEGHKLRAEGDLIFVNTVIETHGLKAVIEYVSDTAVTVNGERYEYQPETESVASEMAKLQAQSLRSAETVSCPNCGGTGSDCSKYPIVGCAACEGDGHLDVNQLANLVAQKVWEAMPKMVRLDYETREALNEYVRGKKDGAKEATELSEEQEKAAFNKGYRQGRSDRAREEISMPIATLIRQLPDTQVEGYFRHRGTICHKLWRCEPPMKCGGEDTEFVVSSRVVNPAYGSPTDLFAANSDGKVTCWAELGRGDYPEDAFRNVGYEAIVK